MDKPISRRAHGFADYTAAPLALIMPNLAGFQNEKTAANLSRLVAGNILTVGLFTRAEWGAFKKIPFKTHLLLDVALGTLTIGAPWLFGFSKNKAARNAFLAMGALSLLSGMLSKPEEMPKYRELGEQ
jgi:hypothetical protein